MTCHVCTAKSDANLCRRHTDELQQAIAELPALASDLQAVATMQAAGPLGLRAGHYVERRTIDDPWIAVESAGDEPWVFAPGAADMLWVAGNTTTTWARHIAETYQLDLPQATRGTWTQTWRLDIHRNRAYCRPVDIWHPSPQQPLAVITTWLLEHLGDIARDEAAEQIHDELTGLHHDMHAATLGAPPADAFYGLCDAPDVRFDRMVSTGPVCGGLPHCTHDSCQRISSTAELLIVASTCKTQLFGTEDAKTLTCPACGIEYTREQRFASMLKELAPTLGTVRQVASSLTQCGVTVTVGQIDGWLRRGLITARGKDPSRHRLVKVADVLAVRAKIGQRRKAAA